MAASVQTHGPHARIVVPRGIIVELFRIIDERAWSALPQVFHTSVIYERPGYAPFEGLAQLTDFYEHIRILIGSHRLEGVLMDEPFGATWGEFIGQTRDGVAVRERFADVYVFEDGKIRRRRTHFFRSAI